MTYNLSNIIEKSQAKIEFKNLLESGSKIELKKLSNKRTSQQNI